MTKLGTFELHFVSLFFTAVVEKLTEYKTFALKYFSF